MTFRDPAYLRYLRTQPCLITGLRGTDVDPMHIGTSGMQEKSPDDEVLPVSNAYHRHGHQVGEMTMFRRHLPDYVLRLALRAYARELYREWQTWTSKTDE